MIRSRLYAMCCHCKCEGPRDKFFRERPGMVPAFGDVCPNCGSESVDVLDPTMVASRAPANGAAVAA